MLSIGKLGRSQEGYYLNAVAKGVEDYYLGSGEAPGRWAGGGAPRLGLAGQVDSDALRAVLDGRAPNGSGQSLIAVRRPDRLPGFDLTFSASKGVSLLFALGDADLSATISAAHDVAVAAALGYLEREAGEVRRGRDGVDRLPGGGLVAAAFRHRTSRAGDPQLHTHMLVANMTRGADGRYSALDGTQLYAQAKTAGTLYQAALRHQLRHLGLAWEVRDNGLAELADVPRPVLRAFSRRRVEIEAALAASGGTSRDAAQIATLATRKAKDYGVHPESLAAGCHARAAELGFDPAARSRLLGRDPYFSPWRSAKRASGDRGRGRDAGHPRPAPPAHPHHRGRGEAGAGRGPPPAPRARRRRSLPRPGPPARSHRPDREPPPNPPVGTPSPGPAPFRRHRRSTGRLPRCRPSAGRRHSDAARADLAAAWHTAATQPSQPARAGNADQQHATGDGESGTSTGQHEHEPAAAAPPPASQEVVMLALRRTDVDELNLRARALLQASGQLTGPQITVPTGDYRELHFAVGDIVIARRNHYPLGPINGHRGHVTAVHPDTGELTARFGGADDPGEPVRLPRGYLTSDGLEHGYALTVHQSQGMTCDTALLLGSEALYREAGYVGLSRGRNTNTLHLVDTTHQPDTDDGCPTGPHRPPGPAGDALGAVRRALTCSHPHQMARDLV